MPLLRYGAHIEARRQRPNAPPRSEIRTRVPDAEVAALRDVRFSSGLRGYDRDEVDRYMTRVNTVLAELQITAAPESAIRHALDQVRLETRSVIERAQREAEEITGRSRARADDRIEEATEEARNLLDAAKQDAKELREAAERDARAAREAADAHVRGLEADVKTMLEKRDRAIEELRDLARSLDDFAKEEGPDRSPSPEPAHADGAG